MLGRLFDVVLRKSMAGNSILLAVLLCRVTGFPCIQANHISLQRHVHSLGPVAKAISTRVKFDRLLHPDKVLKDASQI